jgi:hypothetical protein
MSIRTPYLLVLIFLLFACGSTDEQATETTEEVAEPLPEPVDMGTFLSKIKSSSSSNSLLVGLVTNEGYRTYLIGPPGTDEAMFMVPYLIQPQEDQNFQMIFKDSIQLEIDFRGATASYMRKKHMEITEPLDYLDEVIELVDDGREFTQEFRDYSSDDSDPMSWDSQDDEDILYLTQDLRSITRYHASFTGGAHGAYAYYRITHPSDTLKGLNLNDYYKASEIKELKKKMNVKFNARQFVERDDLAEEEGLEEFLGEPDFDDLYFYLTHERGQVQVYGLMSFGVPYALSGSYELTIEALLGPANDALVKHNKPELDYRLLASSLDGLTDAVLSPAKDRLVVLTSDEIQVFDVGGKESYASDKVPEGQVVMVEWLDEETAEHASQYFEGLYEEDLQEVFSSMKQHAWDEYAETEVHPLDEIPDHWIKLTNSDDKGWIIYHPGYVQNPNVFIERNDDGTYSISVAYGHDSIEFDVEGYEARKDGSFTIFVGDQGNINFTWADDAETKAYWVVPGIPEDSEWLFIAAPFADQFEEVTEEISEEDL